jgi:hypothetical protein
MSSGAIADPERLAEWLQSDQRVMADQRPTLALGAGQRNFGGLLRASDTAEQIATPSGICQQKN